MSLQSIHIELTEEQIKQLSPLRETINRENRPYLTFGQVHFYSDDIYSVGSATLKIGIVGEPTVSKIVEITHGKFIPLQEE